MSTADLQFLQQLSEAELSELILIPLLTRMGYTQVRYTHGVMEMGKDIVFSISEPLRGRKHFALVVKKQKLTGSASGSRSIREILYQVEQAIRVPFLDPLDGQEVTVDTVYVVTPFPISQQCIASIRGSMRDLSNRIRFIDGPTLTDFIAQFYPSIFASLPESLPVLPEKEKKEEPKTGQKRAFILMPFKNPYDSYYPAIFKPALEEVGYKVFRSDDLFTARPVIKDIQESIKKADLILCEMSEKNPNVFYELGLAHAIGKPAIMVSHNEDDIPFDLRHIRIIFYNFRLAGWEEKLRTEIKSAAITLITLQGKEEVWPPPML